MYINRYYYSRLNESEKRLYRFMYECLINNQRRFIYIEEDMVDFIDSNELPIFSYRFDEFIITVNVWNAIILDCPEFYFVDKFDFLLEDNTIVLGNKDSYYTQDEISNINSKFELILKEFDGINDTFELELAINDYFSNYFNYDYETEDYFNLRTDPSFDINKWKRYKEKYSVVGLIKYGKAVCSGYSLLAQYIFQSKGISVINVEGRPYNEKDETIGHRWLMINIDGDYYHYDVTWNSLLSKNLSLPQNVVFNIPTDEALKLYIFDEDYCNISSNSINHNYYNRVGKYYNDLVSISNAVSNFLKSSESYFHFKISNDLKMEDVINLIKEILENNGFKNKYKLRVELTYFAITVC